MSIRTYREPYKKDGAFEYPEFFEAYQKASGSFWRPEEVSFDSDVRDYQNSNNDVREIIGGILKGFTQLECHVSDYWSKVPDWFPKHEIAAVARTFAYSEIVHAHAYNLLSDTLGLDEFEAFLGDPVAQAKIGYFLEKKNVKESLAIFSGAGEGVSLFSSFAILLSFNLVGKFKGLSQIISWSALDEQQHSDTGIALFKRLIQESPLTVEEVHNIQEGFRAVVQNEFAFIDKSFNNRHLDTIDKQDVKNYIMYRANDRLGEMGLEGIFEYDKRSAQRIKDWFHPIITGNTDTDVFSQAKDGGQYISKPTQDFTAINLKTLNLILE
jgi:ribonucleoside-diphosphate reductase beta chain